MSGPQPHPLLLLQLPRSQGNGRKKGWGETVPIRRKRERWLVGLEREVVKGRLTVCLFLSRHLVTDFLRGVFKRGLGGRGVWEGSPGLGRSRLSSTVRSPRRKSIHCPEVLRPTDPRPFPDSKNPKTDTENLWSQRVGQRRLSPEPLVSKGRPTETLSFLPSCHR